MSEKSRLMPISYYNPKQEIRLSAYADTIVLEPDGRKQHLRAIRFGGYPEMVRAMSDAIYAGATLETEFAGEPAMLACEPKKYECHLSHDGIYAEATILSLDDADETRSTNEEEMGGQTNVELPPRKCILFCPAGDRQALFEALDRKTAVPLIPEFQDYVLDELQRRRFLKPLRVISIRERLEAWLLLCKKDDANIVKVLEEGLKSGAIRIPGTHQDLHGFDSVHSVTSYLSVFGVTVAERIRNQFQPLFDPAAEQLSPEILRINDHIREHAGYSLYPAQLAVAESVKRKLSEGKSAFIVAECGSGKTKIGATALAAYQAQKRKKTFSIILCPSHVAKKWVREIAETLPDTAGVIVRSITELDSLYAQYRQGDKSIYAVISKEKARDGYMRRPAVLFDARKGAFRCPGCGSVIELPSSAKQRRYIRLGDRETGGVPHGKPAQSSMYELRKSLVDSGKSKRTFSVGQDPGIRLGASKAGSPCHAEDEEPCRAGCFADTTGESGWILPDARRMPKVSAQLVHQEAVPRQDRRAHRG